VPSATQTSLPSTAPGAASAPGATTNAPKPTQSPIPAKQPNFTNSTSRVRPGAQKKLKQSFVPYEECLRQNGIKLPTRSGKGPILGLKGVNRSTPQFRNAQKKCSSILVAAFKAASKDYEEVSVPFTTAEKRKYIAYTLCMRKHGLKWPMPNFSGRGAIYEGGPSNTTPQFHAADKKCRGL
jgi:hypothetical protein